MDNKRKKLIYDDPMDKVIHYIFVFAVFVLTIYFLWQSFGKRLIGIYDVLKTGDNQAISAYLSSMSLLEGLVSTFLLSMIQVISIVFPGIVIQFAAGFVYGWWQAFIATYLGFVFGNILVFVLAKRTGKKVSKTLELKSEDNWMMEEINNRNPSFVVALACMVPGVPNGIIPYIAATTKMNVKQFGIAVAISCWLQIILNCLAGAFLLQGRYEFTVMSFVIQIIIITIIFKNKTKILSYIDNRK